MTSIALLLAFAAIGPPQSYAQDWKHELLWISYKAPPLVAYFEDTLGRRIGNEPGASISPNGEGPRIQEISKGAIVVDNVGNESSEDDPAKPSSWGVLIFDGGTQPYSLNIQAVTTTVAEIRVGLTCEEDEHGDNGGEVVRRVGLMLPASGRRAFTVVGDRIKKTLVVRRRMTSTGLVESLTLACRLGLVSSDGISQSLQAKAAAATSDAARGRVTAARAGWKGFLGELKAQGLKHVQEPALTILREEAEALLNPPPPFKVKPKPKPAPKATATPK